MPLIFKVCGGAEWASADAAGRYEGSADDKRDGFIHLSTASQLAETLAKHYAQRDGLLLVAVDADSLGDALKWEPSRGGELFPHLYGPLSAKAALWIKPLPCNGEGRHIIPREARA
jgi:uncharacterized protein (DUF952 family)